MGVSLFKFNLIHIKKLKFIHICFGENILKFGLKYRSLSVARLALEKFMLSLPKYAVFARVEVDEDKKCLSQTDLKGGNPRSTVRRVFFGAAVTRKQKRSIFRQPKPYFLLFLAKKSRK